MKRSAVLDALQVRPYGPADETSVLSLLGLTLGGGPAGRRTPEFFRWKHRDNAFGPSFIMVAELDGRIVGLRAFMRWRFRSGSRSFAAVRAVDTATHPDFQGMGVFSRLTTEAVGLLREEVDFVFNTPNPSSLAGYLKMGWTTVGQVPVRIRVRRPVRFARRIRAVKAGEGSSAGRPAVEAAPAADVLEDAEGVSSLLATAVGDDGRVATARSAEYLRWRYADAPALDYRAVTLGQPGVREGLAVFRVRPRGALWETTVSELVVPEGRAEVARRLLRRVVHAAPVDHVTCHVSAASKGSAGAVLGFVPAPRGIVLAVNVLRPGPEPDPTHLRSWSLSLGDLEVF